MSMKRRYLMIASLVSILPAQAADVFGKSFLSIRPGFELNLPERLTMFRDKMDLREEGRRAAFEIVPFYSKTSRPIDIAKYFLPNGKDYITVGEDASQSAVNRSRDINAFNVGVLTYDVLGLSSYQTALNDGYTHLTFESKVTFCPQQKMKGLGLAFQHRLPNDFWLEIAAPVISVQNQLGIKEEVLNSGGGNSNPDVPTGYFGSFLSALSNCNTKLKYGRMIASGNSSLMKKTRLAHIELRAGRDMLCSEQCLFGGFLGAVLPTGNKPCGHYLFEPVVGLNKHWAFLVGSYGKYELMRDDKDRTISTLYNIVTRYYVPNLQYRSMDLRGKPWSRYMNVWKNDNSGVAVDVVDAESYFDYLINYSTLCVKVKPHFSFDFNVGFNYMHGGFVGEVGYNVYARKAEEIFFSQPMKSGIGLPAISNYYNDATATDSAVLYTNSFATINSPIFKLNQNVVDKVVNTSAPNDTNAYVPLTIDDLDPDSGAHPGTISQTFYGSLGYEWRECEFPVFVNGGASYEVAWDNTALSRLAVWFKVGISI